MDSSPIPPSPSPPPPQSLPATVPFTDAPHTNNLNLFQQQQQPGLPITSPPGFNNNQPSYADMIYRAIEALKEKDGSSKRAIAKYIEQVYRTQLPPNHDDLLTQHLKRLKDNGLLVMVKKSYALPRSVPSLPLLNATAAASAASPPSRPRGRPRKVQLLDPAQAQVQAQNFDNNPQQPPILPPAGQVSVQQNAEPVWAALGLADDPQPVPVPAPGSEKKRPGRPRKSGAGAGSGGASAGLAAVTTTTPAPSTAGRRGRPPGSKNKKRVGRPPKVNNVAVTAAVAGASGAKRRPGRPPKNQAQVATQIPFAPAGEGDVAVSGGDVPAPTRLRGRPRRNAVAPAAAAAVRVTSGSGRGRGRGRGGGRGGRGAFSAQPRSSTGRPVGRPKKGTTSGTTTQIAAADEGLRRKLVDFQSKVKDCLDVLKPHFTHESPVTAIAAIQDLEEIVNMNIDAPLEDEIVPQQQQPQVQQQLQPPPPPQQQPQDPPPQQHQPQEPPPQQQQPPVQPLAQMQHFFQQQFTHHVPPYLHHQQQQQHYQNQQPPQQFQNHQHQQPPQHFQPQLPNQHRLFHP